MALNEKMYSHLEVEAQRLEEPCAGSIESQYAHVSRQMALRRKREHKLVSAEWLHEQIESGDAGSFVILEVRWDEPGDENEACKDKSCIPGAICVHPSYFESENDSSKYYPYYKCVDDGNLLGDEALQQAIGALGIDEDTTVVVYGSGCISIMVACRAIWALMYGGVKDVRFMDGGYKTWQAEGYLGAEPSSPERKPWKGEIEAGYLATTQEVQEVSNGNASGALVDIRKIVEHDGSFRNNYWCDACRIFDRAGRIPKSIFFGNWEELCDSSDIDKLLNLSEFRERLDTLGCFKQSGGGPLIFYCGTGWRSSMSFFLSYLLGCEAKNYDDGFYGWSEDPTKEIRYSRPPTPVEDPQILTPEARGHNVK